jgi:hypothetical protein
MFRAFTVIAIGIALLVAASLTAMNTQHFVLSSVVVPGRVVALNAGGSHPKMVFVTRRGERLSYPEGGFIFDMKVGNVVQLRYAEDEPLQSATLDKVGTIWFGPVLLALLGGGFLVAGLLSWLE